MAKKQPPNETNYIADFGAWKVSTRGDLINEIQNYSIRYDRLVESDTWAFFRAIPNFDWNSFIPAYFKACEIAKHKQLKLDLII